jgi:hypothetical protein
MCSRDGRTTIVQRRHLAPAVLAMLAGAEKFALLRLSPDGIIFAR